MDDPPLARANNTELIRDVLAIMFHVGVAFRTCPLYYGQSKKPNFLPDFFLPRNDRLPGVRHLPADMHRSSVRVAIVR